MKKTFSIDFQQWVSKYAKETYPNEFNIEISLKQSQKPEIHKPKTLQTYKKRREFILGLEGIKNFGQGKVFNLIIKDIDDQEDMRFVFEILKINASITSLKLKYIGLETIDLQPMMKPLFKNISLALSTDFTNIRELSLINGIIANDVSIFSSMLTGNTILTSLDFSTNEIGNKGIKALSNSLKTNSTLTSLRIRNNKINSEGAEFISQMLRANSKLTYLYLEENEIGDIGIKHICNAEITNNSLACLDISQNGITLEGAKSIAHMLRINTFLTHLYFGGDITTEGTRFICNALETNNSLVCLEISDNQKTTLEDARSISQMLKTNTSLTKLHLSNNDLFYQEESTKLICKAIKNNQSLTFVDFTFNNIGSKAVKSIANMLKTNSTITYLDLSYNNHIKEGIKFISDILRINSKIIKLYLQGNNVKVIEVRKFLFLLLCTNKTLTSLTVGEDSYTPEIKAQINANIALLCNRNKIIKARQLTDKSDWLLKQEPFTNDLEKLIQENIDEAQLIIKQVTPYIDSVKENQLRLFASYKKLSNQIKEIEQIFIKAKTEKILLAAKRAEEVNHISHGHFSGIFSTTPRNNRTYTYMNAANTPQHVEDFRLI